MNSEPGKVNGGGLDQARNEINALLEEILPHGSERPESLHNAMRYAVLGGGKRLRAILCVWTHEVLGGKHRTAAMTAGCAIECLHAYTLIHDDLPCLDDDDTRRGRPSCHIKYGEAVALLAGDALQAYAFQLISELKDPAVKDIISAVRLLSKTAGSKMLVGGQVADIEGEGKRPDENIVRFIHARKTAELISTSMGIGAILSGVGQDVIVQIKEAGRKAGLAFQIADDILDVRGDEKLVGKGLRKDDEKGKITWPACFGLESAEKMAKCLIDESIEIVKTAGDDGRIESLFKLFLERVS
ncbi:MAG: polyprenyl synthetase family protein [Bacteroidales bacterium]|nr:polyprenyl synthetase family protein [Candidatus Latescibacterota bacterium]